MPKYKHVWDKIMPLSSGTRVRYVKNKCKLAFKKEEWFKAREKNIGKVGTVETLFLPNDVVYMDYFHYFRYLKSGNLYAIKMDKPAGNYTNYYCTRDELEVI